MNIRTMLMGAAILAAMGGAAATPAAAQELSGVVGSAVVRMVGGGDDAELVVEQVVATQPRRLAMPGWGHGGSTAVRYLEPEPVSPGRFMVMVGGGDDARLEAVAPAAPASVAGAPAGRPRG